MLYFTHASRKRHNINKEVNMNNDYNCADFDLDSFDLGADVSFDQEIENDRMADIVLSGWGNDSTCWI